MKIKLDENLPQELKATLGVVYDIDTVHDECLTGQDDDVIWQAVQAEQRLLITQDLDFSDLRRFLPGSHHGIILIRLRSPSRQAIIDRMSSLESTIPLGSLTGCFVVVTDSKVRVRSPH